MKLLMTNEENGCLQCGISSSYTKKRWNIHDFSLGCDFVEKVTSRSVLQI